MRAMSKEKKSLLFFVGFFGLTLILALALVFHPQSFLRRAAPGELEAVFDPAPGGNINRIWTNFAQGGEEKGLMLQSASSEIERLEPQFIRIDHLYDFPNLSKRVEEIVALGATPALSLSYFPAEISPQLTQLPSSLEAWQTLVEKTVRDFSGPGGKNIPGIYYEVWNEPDLFGQMSPEDYYSLYRSSVEAASRCSECRFKIGGPAITTLKIDWMDRFLGLVADNKTRLDFVSWHSYQKNPQKTLWEAQTLKNLPGFRRLGAYPELIISEWGPVPELSPLNDSYYAASHVISTVALMKKSVNKLFAFELKDGPSPEGKKHWGRWGLLTHQSFGLSHKPRYFAFIYLNKLLARELEPVVASPGLSILGSTDGRERFVFLFTQNSPQTTQTNLRLKRFPPGVYQTTSYHLDSSSQPLKPLVSQTNFNGGEFNLSYQLPGYGVVLTQLTRISSALVKTPGRTESPTDRGAKLTSFVPPLVFPLYSPPIQNLEVSFWFKPNWGQEAGPYPLWESLDGQGNGLTAWVEKEGFLPQLYFALLKENQVVGQIKTSFPNESTWRKLNFKADNPRMVIGLSLDGEEKTESFSPSAQTTVGDFIYLGANFKGENFAEGSLDELVISVNSEIIYRENFDQPN